MLTTDCTQIITIDNVKQLGELMAIHALKTAIGYSGVAAIDLYNGLIKDIYHLNDINHVISDGYDIAQAASCFLCGYIAKTLGEEAGTGTEKNGSAITIKRACYKAINRCIRQERTKIYRNVCIDDLSGKETAVPFEFETENDYTEVDEKIRQMNLTEQQRAVLIYRMNGITFREIDRLLSISSGATWSKLMTVRKKYSRQFC